MPALTAALLSSGCLTRVAGPADGPEQFQFTMVARAGAGPEAEAIAQKNVGIDQYVRGTARLVGTVTTPLGQVDILHFQLQADGVLNHCEGEFGPQFGSWGCGPAGQEVVNPLLDGDVISAAGGGGSQDWTQGSIRVADGVTRIAALAADGTAYAIVPANGYGYIVWPTKRGDLTLTALDVDGSEIGTASMDAVEVAPGVT